MSKYTINIVVNDKVARLADPSQRIVCNNNDYVACFILDEEWDEYQAKTMRFTYDGHVQDIPFKGLECPMPLVRGTKLVEVGLYAGDLHTTTPAYIYTNKSILCEDGAPPPPTDEVYNQIMDKINSGMLKGDKGDKGDVHLAVFPFDETDGCLYVEYEDGYEGAEFGITEDGYFEVTVNE